MPRTSRNRRSDPSHASARKQGMMPGAPVYVGPDREGVIGVRLLDFGPDGFEEVDSPTTERLAACLGAATVSWIDLDGVHGAEQVQAVGTRFSLHPLWIEDILNPAGRPKVEKVGELVFVRLRMLRLTAESEVDVETVSLILGPTWVLSFQERPGDVWNPVRERIRTGTGRIRRMGADYLLHALIDAVVDAYFAVLAHLEQKVDDVEDEALERPDVALPTAIAELKTELATVRSAVWPVREALTLLLREREVLISSEAVPFFRDVLDHLAQISDQVDSMRDRLLSAVELSLAVSGHKLNEVMRVLTIVSTVFLPMTFLAGVWGMNFDVMPELHERWGYPLAIFTMVGSGGAMVGYFRHKGWF